MPSSRKIIQKDRAAKLAIDYEARAIESQLSDEAREFVENKDQQSDFRLDKLVSEYTGIDELERLSRQREIESEALTLSKEVQESAYKEAYDLGFEEGKKEAFEQEKEKIASEIANVETLIRELKNAKVDIYQSCEEHIVKLCLYLAKRLMMKEIEGNEAYTAQVIKKALEMAQTHENVTVKLSPEDYKYIEAHQEDIWKELHLKDSVKIEEAEAVKRGGAILETNFGVIDATIDERISKIESILLGNKSE